MCHINIKIHLTMLNKACEAGWQQHGNIYNSLHNRLKIVSIISNSAHFKCTLLRILPQTTHYLNH